MLTMSFSFRWTYGILRTSPFPSLLLRFPFCFWEAAELLQRADCALTHNRLPPKLTVVNDFDDDWRHVKVLDGEPLGRNGTIQWWEKLSRWSPSDAYLMISALQNVSCWSFQGHEGLHCLSKHAQKTFYLKYDYKATFYCSFSTYPSVYFRKEFLSNHFLAHWWFNKLKKIKALQYLVIFEMSLNTLRN